MGFDINVDQKAVNQIHQSVRLRAKTHTELPQARATHCYKCTSSDHKSYDIYDNLNVFQDNSNVLVFSVLH